MAGNPTIYDIARQAGVGIATVSRVLNGGARVSEDARAKVQAAVAALGYRPNRAARRLAAGGLNRPRIAALVPLFSADFYANVARALARGVAAAGMDMVLVDVADREDKLRHFTRLVEERACEGLVLCSMGLGEERQDMLRGRGVPFVALDYRLPGVPSCWVDNRAGGRMAAQCLLDRGARRLGWIDGPATVHAFHDRAAGFDAVAGADAPRVRAPAVTRDDGRAAATQLLDLHPELDGLVCANDLYAVGALEILRMRGRTVPDQVQVIGFDDQPLMDHIGLTTVRQPMAGLGAWAAAAITRLVVDPVADIPGKRFALELVARSTTRESAVPA
jgi:DNA-binding LacI/PurR family transcriptional regulator